MKAYYLHWCMRPLKFIFNQAVFLDLHTSVFLHSTKTDREIHQKQL